MAELECECKSTRLQSLYSFCSTFGMFWNQSVVRAMPVSSLGTNGYEELRKSPSLNAIICLFEVKLVL